jgi:hypothetical protein
MPQLADAHVFWGLLAVQVVGLISMALARLPHSSLVHALCRGCFFGCLAIVGLATLATISAHSHCWAWCGTTFSIMAVGVTADFGTARVEGF